MSSIGERMRGADRADDGSITYRHFENTLRFRADGLQWRAQGKRRGYSRVKGIESRQQPR